MTEAFISHHLIFIEEIEREKKEKEKKKNDSISNNKHG
jgi:hypothetical protein